MWCLSAGRGTTQQVDFAVNRASAGATDSQALLTPPWSRQPCHIAETALLRGARLLRPRTQGVHFQVERTSGHPAQGRQQTPPVSPAAEPLNAGTQTLQAQGGESEREGAGPTGRLHRTALEPPGQGSVPSDPEGKCVVGPGQQTKTRKPQVTGGWQPSVPMSLGPGNRALIRDSWTMGWA